MSGFSPEWLALREPADRSARSTVANAFVGDSLARDRVQRVIASERFMHALDLGCGTGANVRYLNRALWAASNGSRDLGAPAPSIGWRVVDNDAALLAVTRDLLGPSADIRQADMRGLDESWFHGIELVTASALLDLVSEHWLRQLIQLCARHAVAVLFALNYDGRIEAAPGEPDDEWVRDLVNQHQQTDKGFGAALGPRSGDQCAEELQRNGFDVCVARSDWELDDSSRELQRLLVQGWAAAAAEMAPLSEDRVRVWEQRRQLHIAAGTSRLRVGHVDVAGRHAARDMSA